MQNVTDFINLLGENYYLDFIIQPYAEEVDYEKHFVLVHYQDKKYYEQTHEYIQIKQNEIIHNAKSLFQKSISEIYLEVSKRKNEEIENFLNLNIKAVNVKLNILKNDFYIENDNSRYFAILYDDADPQTLETFFSKRDYSTTTTNLEIRSVIQKLNSGNIKSPLLYYESDFFIEFHLQRFKLLSSLPFKLFHIGLNFIIELNKIRLMSKIEVKHQNILNSADSSKPFKDDYLIAFCKEISNERIIKETCFDLVYEGIVHYIPYLETEVIENLLLLDNDKKEDYLNYAIDKIKKTPFVGNDKINIDKWLKKYNETTDEFPNFNNKELKHWLGRYYNGYSETQSDLDFILDIQIDFYCYASMVEANKMIDFLQTKKSKSSMKSENNKEEEYSNQLSVNQAIILLDRLGLFSSTMLENLPNTKKAKLISQIIGKNDKNIKTAIEKLELKQNEIKPNHQKDIDKIERILNNLE